MKFWPASAEVDESGEPPLDGGWIFGPVFGLGLEALFGLQFEGDAVSASVVFGEEIVVHRGMVPPDEIFFNFKKVLLVHPLVKGHPCKILDAQKGHHLSSATVFAVAQCSVFPVLERVMVLDARSFPRVDGLSDVVLSEKG